MPWNAWAGSAVSPGIGFANAVVRQAVHGTGINGGVDVLQTVGGGNGFPELAKLGALHGIGGFAAGCAGPGYVDVVAFAGGLNGRRPGILCLIWLEEQQGCNKGENKAFHGRCGNGFAGRIVLTKAVG